MAGKAYLVGAGPGRTDLITVRGLSLLREADVVIYDRLIGDDLLREAPPHAEKIFVGKSPAHHSHPQDDTSALIVEQVQAGKQVVRLKGGDPFVFGRGGEEALALAKAALPFEIVPGISSAIAVPAYAGIPVTQREYTTSFAVVTGHESPDKPESDIDWYALSKIPTLVILMGARNMQRISQILIEFGRNPHTPAAAIHQGTTHQQRTVHATLTDLSAAIAADGLTPPMVIVVGEVAALADQMAWFTPENETSHLVSLFEEAQRRSTTQERTTMTKREIVLIGHGSEVPEAIEEFHYFADSLSHHIEHSTRVCFLEISQPEMYHILHDTVTSVGDNGEMLVVPLLLGSAFHMKAEITTAIHRVREEFPNVAIKLSTPLGFHIHLAELLKVRVDEALARTLHALPPEETTVLVIGGGSSDLDSNSSVAKVGRVLYETSNYQGVEVAYQRVTHPTTAEGLERVQRLGAKQVVLAPYLLFTGIVYQNMVRAADEAATRLGLKLIHAQYLGPSHPLLVEVVAQRLQEAADGTSELFRHKAIEGIPQVLNSAHHLHHEHGHHHSHDHHHHHEHPHGHEHGHHHHEHEHHE